jgi:CDP-glucose 4,6-dehydratase
VGRGQGAVEGLVKLKTTRHYFNGAYAGKKIFVTGHTGFKGSWLCEWLLQLGAEVTGYSLPPEAKSPLFNQLGLKLRLQHIIGDIREPVKLSRALQKTKPDFVFHLAAQPLVLESYAKPVESFETNLMGTVNLLEALRAVNRPCAAVFITSDKCYENGQRRGGYHEKDPLGGHDPYSASKATAEIAISAYRRSFFKNHPVKIASARAGNVIGGGDWAKDRIIPDCIRALQKRLPISVRNPNFTRPWQHVLEPLSGYLWLAVRLSDPSANRDQLCSAFNFGPAEEANRTVADLTNEVLNHWSGRWEDKPGVNAPHEAVLLQLVTDKAHALLDWSPVWNFSKAVEFTVQWYRRVEKVPVPAAIQKLTAAQIAAYAQDARRMKIPWAAA